MSFWRKKWSHKTAHVPIFVDLRVNFILIYYQDLVLPLPYMSLLWDKKLRKKKENVVFMKTILLVESDLWGSVFHAKWLQIEIKPFYYIAKGRKTELCEDLCVDTAWKWGFGKESVLLFLSFRVS